MSELFKLQRIIAILFALSVPVAFGHGLTYVNGKQVKGYAIELKPNGDTHVTTMASDFDCRDYGGSLWELGSNINGHGHHIGVIPFVATGTGRFVVSSQYKINAGISECPAGFWLNDDGCGMSAKSGTILWRAGGQDSRCNLQAGKTYYLNVRSPDCNNQSNGCVVKITK